MPSSIQQRTRRFSVRWCLVASHQKHEIVRGHVINISLTGLRIEVVSEYTLGALIQIEMTPSPDVFIRVMGKIIRTHTSKAGYYSYGVRIINQKEEDRRLLQELLLKLRREEWNA